MAARLLVLALLLPMPACARGAVTLPEGGLAQPDGGQAPEASDSGAGGPQPAEAGPEPEADAAPAEPGIDASSDDAGSNLPGTDAGQSPADAGHGPGEQADAGPELPVIASQVVGGAGGSAFDDTSMLPDRAEVKSVTVSSGDRVDRVELVLRSGTVLRHGGPGGGAQTLELNPGEAIVSAHVCTGEFDDSTRVFYIKFGTSLGRSFGGGVETSTCTDLMAPAKRQVTGLVGRAGEGVDAIGFLYTQRVGP